MRYRFYIVDVFTDTLFGGNPLAVLSDARGLSSEAMQEIGREFNLSETTFVLPPTHPEHTRQVRIFTPKAELPFAGHPNIGTAFTLAATGEVEKQASSQTLLFEEKAGLVPVTVEFTDAKPVHAELTAPQAPQLGSVLDLNAVAQSLSLAPQDILGERHPPQLASAGIDILCVELRDRDVLARARALSDKAELLLPRERAAGFYLYTTDTDDPAIDIQARMFAPQHGITEDPATGSAAAALAGLLAHGTVDTDATLRWRIAQGVEMGRPSLLETSADKQNGQVTAVRVGGRLGDGRGGLDRSAGGTLEIYDVQ